MLAIGVAQFFHLDNYASAAILTIICIQVTKKRSLISAWTRFCACILAIPFSFVLFETLGYYPFTLGIMILLFLPVLIRLKIQEGLITSSVIILHFYKLQEYTLSIILNEFFIIVIAIGIALLMNLYMPSMEKDLKQYQRRIEDNFRTIFKEFASYIRAGDDSWDGKEITETAELLKKAKSDAFLDIENHFLRHEDKFYHYFEMREKQFEIMERVMPIISTIHDIVEEEERQIIVQRLKIASFLNAISEGINPGNTAKIYLQQLEDMHEEFRTMPLPQTQIELEKRSSLLQFLKEMEQYLIIKRYFRQSDV